MLPDPTPETYLSTFSMVEALRRNRAYPICRCTNKARRLATYSTRDQVDVTKHNISRLVDLLCKSDQKSGNLRLAYVFE